MSETIHASCVALDGQAVLLAGPPGSGKSDLALRLIDTGATLVADDRTALSVKEGTLLAAPPAVLQGLIEVRQIRILRLPFVTDIPVVLYIELGAAVERLPETDFIELQNCRIRRLRLNAFEASTPAKIRAALKYPAAEV